MPALPLCVDAYLNWCLRGLCVCSHTRVAIVAKQGAFEALQALSLTDPQRMLQQRRLRWQTT